ncbi:hypothetical protein MF271_20035 (plasmid) [Deinococcus sp. KNUC1210]|uniref:hypothetical protein n=1 Tax=Deinococcus sp. KNUC1210 TaxID=2917691 RepID=UPI001EEFA916|nr:hypothetical protein [Deinococcus sp. KNUC1210]ULH17702.1 hypothetical protein MF271_20035 [Deinococcus sp. KNUC1210]
MGAHRKELLGKTLFGLVQKGFQAFVIDVVVAISDQVSFSTEASCRRFARPIRWWIGYAN